MLLITIEGHAMLDEHTLVQYRNKLNSEVIAATFGSYGVEVIHENNESRLSNLYSDDKVMRTCAIVDYAIPIPASLIKAHEEIVAGGSIGATLKKHGFALTKKPLYFGEIRLTDSLRAAMKVANETAAVHIYELFVGETRYCIITEIHSPVYLNTHGLKLLYPDEYEQHRISTHEVSHLLHKASHLDLSVYTKKVKSKSEDFTWSWMLRHPYLLTASIGVPLFLFINSRYNLFDFNKAIRTCSKLIAETDSFTFFANHRGTIDNAGLSIVRANYSH